MSASIHPVRNLISNGASLHQLIPLLTYLAVQPPSDSKWKWKWEMGSATIVFNLAVQPPSDSKWKWKWGQPPLFSTWRFRRQVSYGSLTAHCPTPSVQHRVFDTLLACPWRRCAAALV